MLHKFYYSGKSRRNNDMFSSPTHDHILILPFSGQQIRDLIKSRYDLLDLRGFMRCLYLERPENSNRYWKVVVAIWKNGFSYDIDDEPIQIVRITTDDFGEVVVDRFTGKYVEQLPMSAFYNFLSTGYSSF